MPCKCRENIGRETHLCVALSIFPIRCSPSLNTSPWSARSSYTPHRGCSRSSRRGGSFSRRGISRSLPARWACCGMGREPGLHVQGHGRGVRATARALRVWRGNHHDEHGRGGNHHLRHNAVCEGVVREMSQRFDCVR